MTITKERLIEVANQESANNGKCISGYCCVDGDISVFCTRDNDYVGYKDDCIHAHSSKFKCRNWVRIKPFIFEG